MSPRTLEMGVCVVFAVICFLSSLQLGNGMQCLNGFLGRDAVEERAAYIGRNVRREKQQRIFPDIKFTCSGFLTAWKMVLEDRQQDRGRTKFPEFQIWRKSDDNENYSKVHGQSGNPTSTEHANVYEYTGLFVSFQAGDVLGIHQPDGKKSRYSVLFQERGGPMNYRIEDENDSLSSFDSSHRDVRSDESDYPLVGLNTNNIDCVTGFLSIGALIAKGAKEDNEEEGGLASEESRQELFPELKFGCSGVINSWIFAAEDRGTDGRRRDYPELQLWRDEPAVTKGYTKNHSTNLQQARRLGLNIYQYTLDPPVSFSLGNSLGMYHPSDQTSALTLYHLEDDGALTGYYIESIVPFSPLSTAFMMSEDGKRPLITVTITPDCGRPAEPVNGRVTVDPDTTADSLATYQCDPGYRINGERQTVCQESNGLWSGIVPTCQLIDCGPLPPPNNGTVSIEPGVGGINVGGTATYSCDDGYMLIGDETRRCQNRGTWTGRKPRCLLISCSVLEDPENGRVTTTTTGSGAAAFYRCNPGYVLVGNSDRTCEAGEWAGAAPRCEAVACGEPASLENGNVVIFGTMLSTTALYSCDEGYMLDGEERHTCLDDGTWSGQLPKCKGILLPVPTTTRQQQASLSLNNLLFRSSIPAITEGIDPPPSRDSEQSHMTTLLFTSSVGLLSNTGGGGNSVGSTNFIIAAVVATLVVLLLVIAAICTALFLKWRRYKIKERTEEPQQQGPISVENPVYTTDSNTMDVSWSLRGGGQLPLAASNQESHLRARDTVHYYDSATVYDQPTAAAASPHYETASTLGVIYHSYETPGFDPSTRYEMATGMSASQYEIPVSPYELPTPRSLKPPTDIYGTLQWGIFVPTEEQRRLSMSTVGTVSDDQSFQSFTPLSPPEQRAFFAENEVYWKPASDPASLYDQLAKNKYREILRHQIQITHHLGSGQFGTVNKGLWQSPVDTIEVAVKTLKKGSTENDRIKFLQEAAINGQFRHPNVVKLHGVVTVGEPVMIVLELLPNGDLRKYLVKNRPAPGEMMAADWPQIFVKFYTEIASGMQYLSGKAFVHRDLAARNILVAEDKTCKISDFGMSRDLMDENYYVSHGGKIPVKWTAPEALHFKKYSTASDVWSFGAVMYEIWSLGHKPFEGYTNPQTVKMIDRGYRLPPPPGCPRAIYEVMIHCWHPKTSSRPTFSQLVETLSSSTEDLLIWSEEDRSVHQQAAVLGAPLEAGKELYPELQNVYNTFDQQQL